jgi:flagellar hook assembly protein FlgD
MTARHILLLALAEALALGAMGAMLYRALSASPAPVVQGQEGPARLVVMHPGVPRGALRLRRSDTSHVHSAPLAPQNLRQIGGREPAMRVLAAGAWINATSFDVRLRMSSRRSATRLQPQVELRPADQPFSGQPTATGAAVSYRGAPILGIVHLTGLRDGLAYHWRVRVHDMQGPNSRWIALHGAAGVALRVHLAPPSAPALHLVTPAQPGGWVGTRWLALRWAPPADRSGIRGYSYTLARSPRAQPALRWRSWLTEARVRAGADGLWYFTVRALNAAHSWGPPARVAVRIDTRRPRVQVLSVPGGAVNPRRRHPLLRLLLTAWSRVTVDVVAPDGRVVRSLPTPVHAPSSRLGITWNGLTTARARVPNGRYRLRIIATNRGGVTWHTTRSLYVEDVPPAFTSFGFSQPGTYNPYNNGLDGPEVITATLDNAARVRVEALHGDRVMRAWLLTEPRAGAVITTTWDGATVEGHAMPGGLYTFRAVAVDAAGNRTTAQLGSVVLDHRRIVVSLHAQRLWALDGNRVLLTTLVTTGGPELPTPTGDFEVIDRESPFTFVSPYPPGSPYWYPPSPANFVLLFQVNGYFIHDAPWRTFYGPGSNSVDGTPGTNNTGTHGCVNVPYQAMLWLFNWATMDTPVQVRQHFTPG